MQHNTLYNLIITLLKRYGIYSIVYIAYFILSISSIYVEVVILLVETGATHDGCIGTISIENVIIFEMTDFHRTSNNNKKVISFADN